MKSKRPKPTKTIVFSMLLVLCSVTCFTVDAQHINKQKISIELKDVNLKVFLQELQKKTGFKSPHQGNTRVISGTTEDNLGMNLPGVIIYVQGTSISSVSDENGKYNINIPTDSCTLIFSYLGMQEQRIKFKTGNENIEKKVILKEDNQIEEVVVTGIVNKNKNSFTGSASTFSGDELRTIGIQNPIASLKALDPAFNVLESELFGSDPNRLPDINIRGRSSLIGIRDEAASNPNQPLFIVDGFESSLEAVYNLDINRIASMTILKDAASTAIYGSKAANGVVVVETVKPQAGKLRLSYAGSLAVSSPDLTSYNLMNAEEKLEFEKLAGRYSSNNVLGDRYLNEIYLTEVYNERLKDIQSGVDTYWLKVPLRTGTTNKHRLYAEGGEGGFLFGLGVNYSAMNGVMKQSDRDQYDANIDILYRLNKLQFQNKLMISFVDSQDPAVAFSEYALANPYYKKENIDGEIDPWLEYSDFAKVPNPLYNASINSRNETSNLSVTNHFIAEYMPIESVKLRAKVGITHQSINNELFTSPSHTKFDGMDASRKGTYQSNKGESSTYDISLTAIYANVIKQHRYTFAVDAKIAESRLLQEGYSVEGFPEGNYVYPSFSKGYPEGGSPTYYEVLSRSANFLGTMNYAYDNRYLFDLNYTLNGSSVFGSNKKFINTYSFGIGWNIMNESFFKNNIDGVSMLKLRFSIGNPGNQNFDSAKSLTTYSFLYNSFNYFGTSSILDQLGNANLRWQTTLDRNYGLDLTLLNDRLNFTFDYYDKRTDPLLIGLNKATYAGVNTWYTNLGEQNSKGVLATINYYLIRQMDKRFFWSFRGTLRHENIKINDVGRYLDDLNAYGKSRDTKRYFDGADPDAIWAVQSAGIDPSNGKELFIKKDGKYTYDFSYEDEVIVGSERPAVEGTFGSNISYKGFSLGFNFVYRLGGEAFNTALYNKVENISLTGLNYNQDKRALYDRWQNPGDRSKFKNIATSNNTPISSRFVQKNNSLTLQSIQFGYDFYEIAEKFGMQSMKLSAYMNDVFWLASMKRERGTNYPFARTFTLALSFTL